MDRLNIPLGSLVLTFLCGIHSRSALGITSSSGGNSSQNPTTSPTSLPLTLSRTSIETEWFHVLSPIGYSFPFVSLSPISDVRVISSVPVYPTQPINNDPAVIQSHNPPPPTKSLCLPVAATRIQTPLEVFVVYIIVFFSHHVPEYVLLLCRTEPSLLAGDYGTSEGYLWGCMWKDALFYELGFGGPLYGDVAAGVDIVKETGEVIFDM
ncbi:cytochrome c biogenesis B [Tanacetum coccineum]